MNKQENDGNDINMEDVENLRIDTEPTPNKESDQSTEIVVPQKKDKLISGKSDKKTQKTATSTNPKKKLKDKDKSKSKSKKKGDNDKYHYTDDSDTDEDKTSPPITNKLDEKVDNKKKKKVLKVDNVREDPPINGQKFFLTSFCTPEGVRNCRYRLFKVRGSYSTYKEAQEKAEELRKDDPYFHIFVGEVGKWLEFDPDTKQIKDQNYMQKELNEIMTAQKEQFEKTKKLHDQRVNDSTEYVNDGGRMKKVKDKLRQRLKDREVEGEDITGKDAENPKPRRKIVEDPTEKSKEKSTEESSDKSNKKEDNSNPPSKKKSKKSKTKSKSHVSGPQTEKELEEYEKKLKNDQLKNLDEYKRIHQKELELKNSTVVPS